MTVRQMKTLINLLEKVINLKREFLTYKCPYPTPNNYPCH